MRYRLVIFDFDGTLSDSFAWFMGVFNQVAGTFGFRAVSEADREALRNRSIREISRHLGVPWWRLPAISRHMHRLMAGDIERIALFAGAAGLLRRLAERGATLAIVTSNSQANVERVLGPDNRRWIRFIEGGASIFGKHRKIKKIVRQSRIPAGRCVYVGDEIRDIEAAHKAGIACLSAAWGYSGREALQNLNPADVAADFGDLEARLLGD